MSIHITKTQFKVSDFVSWQRSGTLQLNPDFQRRSVWNKWTKSFFIDTIINGFPVPIIFLRDKFDLTNYQQIREVIDGQQRLRTILAYIGGEKLLPHDYKAESDNFMVQPPHEKELVGKHFSELNKQQQKQILEYEFSVHVLPSSIEDPDVLQIFRRMNSTSNYPLNKQELRNSNYFGVFKTSMYQLAAERLMNWREWGVFKEEEITRMKEVELTSYICAIMLNPQQIRTLNLVDLDEIYQNYDTYYPRQMEIERRFRIVMETIDTQFNLETIKLVLGESKHSFYGFFFFLYDQLFGLNHEIKDNVMPNEQALEQIKQFKDKLNDEEFLQLIDEIKQTDSTDVGSYVGLLRGALKIGNTNN